MKHDDAFSDSLFDASNQMTELTAIEPNRVGNLATKRTNLSALAPVKRFETHQSVAKEAEKPTDPIVDDFLPIPNRWLIFGSLGLMGVLGLGAIVLTALPHRIVINVKAQVQPTAEPQLLQSVSEGTVQSIAVQNYEALQPNQVIASFENPALYTEFRNLKTGIQQTKQYIRNLDDEIATLQQRKASGNWLAFEVSQSQFEYSKKLLLRHQEELQQQLAEQQQRLVGIQQQLDKTTIYAPIAGTLYDLEIKNVGQIIKANEPIAKIIPQDTTMQVKALVSETEAGSIEVGFPTQINLTSCAYSNFGILEGTVKSVEAWTPQSADNSFITAESPAANINHHVVTVEVSNNDGVGSQPCKLLPGAEGEINIIAKQERFLNFFLRKLGFSRNV